MHEGDHRGQHACQRDEGHIDHGEVDHFRDQRGVEAPPVHPLEHDDADILPQ